MNMDQNHVSLGGCAVPKVRMTVESLSDLRRKYETEQRIAFAIDEANKQIAEAKLEVTKAKAELRRARRHMRIVDVLLGVAITVIAVLCILG